MQNATGQSTATTGRLQGFPLSYLVIIGFFGGGGDKVGEGSWRPSPLAYGCTKPQACSANPRSASRIDIVAQVPAGAYEFAPNT